MSVFRVNQDNDLPLMANVEDIRVNHYFMRFKLAPDEQCFYCEIILEVKSLKNSKKESEFEFILDCCDLEVICASEVVGSLPLSRTKEGFNESFDLVRSPLKFSLDKWSLRIRKDGCVRSDSFPKLIYVQYKTKPQGQSLMWRKCQDGNPCVFTPASVINNRALFPCQEPPIAMATWQAEISVPNNYSSVLCTGDLNGQTLEEDGWCHHYFFTQMTLPMSTFAIAIGSWQYLEIIRDSDVIKTRSKGVCNTQHDPYPCHVSKGDSGPLIPCRIFFPMALQPYICQKWIEYIKACLEASYNLLGPHPFDKLDILILPRCYSGLGLASPSLMFLSQSLVVKGGYDHAKTSMMIRIAHEVSHSWFGLVIGALDWTEEWLSEGFATFAEDYIHTETLKIMHCFDYDDPFEGLSELRSFQRYQTLVGELENTKEELQTLRPMQGHELKDLQKNVAFVKNALNPEMAVTQVHYIKGYFLLRHFVTSVGEGEFFKFLRHYIHDLYHGKLVHSTEFLTLFFGYFPDKFKKESCQDNVIQICGEWLDDHRIPKEVHKRFENFFQSTKGFHGQQLLDAVSFWRTLRLNKSKSFKETVKVPDGVKNIVSEQLVILLEEIIRRDNVSKKELELLKLTYDLETKQCADVQHRWCELVIKHHYASGYDFVKEFLLENQSMGVYLYGELAGSSSKKLRRMSKDIFEQLKPEMDPVMIQNVTSLLFDEK